MLETGATHGATPRDHPRRRTRRDRHQPGQGLLPGRRRRPGADARTSAEAPITKLELVRYYLAVADGALRGAGGRPMALKRYPNGAAGDVLLPEARAREAAGLVRTVELTFPSRPDRRRESSSTTRRRWPGWSTSAASTSTRTRSGPTTSTTPTSCGSTSTPSPASPGTTSGRWRSSCATPSPTSASSAGRRPRARRGIHVNVRIERRWTFPEVRRAALALARDVERRAPGARHQPVVEGGAPRRLHRLQPERQGPHGRLRRTRSARGPTPASRRRCAGTRSPTWTPAAFTLRTVPERFARDGDAHAGIDDAAGSLDGLLELSARHEAEGLGDAPWPPNYAKTLDEPPRVAAVEAADEHRSRSSRSGARRSRPTRSRAWSAGRRATPTPGRTSRPADVLVDAMRGRSTTWTRIRLNLENVPPDLRPAQEALDPDYDPWAGVEWPARSRGDAAV